MDGWLANYVLFNSISVISGPEVIKKIPCLTQLNMKFVLLINIKVPTTVGILTCMSMKNSILGLSEPEKSCIS